jgi:hypothetical protein
MSSIIRKIAEFFGLKSPEQAAMESMMEMEEQEAPSDDMAAMPGAMEMVPVESEERKKRGEGYDM